MQYFLLLNTINLFKWLTAAQKPIIRTTLDDGGGDSRSNSVISVLLPTAIKYVDIDKLHNIFKFALKYPELKSTYLYKYILSFSERCSVYQFEIF